ncbi:MAG: Crp/Fnr family transcriptional regulator [Brevundimonas sp.]
MPNALIEKLSRRGPLGPDEVDALRDATEPPICVPAGQDLVRPHESPSHSTVLLSGFCARYTSLSDGRRQFTEINIMGDFVDLHSLLMQPMDHGVVTLTPCRVAHASHGALRRITQQHPHLTRLLWQDTLIDAAIHRQWLVGVGRRSGLGRFAHLLCELDVRLAVVGQSENHRFQLPLTQSELGDAMGLSAVHVNRLLADLRREGLLQWQGQRVRILDWERLVDLAEFEPGYLQLAQAPA